MDRRNFSRLVVGVASAPLAALSACGGGGEAGAAAQDTSDAKALGAAGVPAIIKWRAKPNPTGLRFGFWDNFNHQDVTLAAMGRRPSARVGFDAWNLIETERGNYQWPQNDHQALTHRHGETILAAVNICFCVPSGEDLYDDDISAPATREAAKAFLYEYVRRLLQTHGSVVLTIDYEIVSNYLLAKGAGTAAEQARKWREWYVDHAVPTARRAAYDLGMAAMLKLQPIFNGNPLAENHPVAVDKDVKTALLDVVRVSDYLALDTYFSDPTRDVSNASHTIDIIAFWYDTYAKPNGKEVIVTENGFSTITERYPEIDRDSRDGKYTGYEAQQDDYYANLFPLLLAANQKKGVFENKLRGFHIWCILDNDKRGEKDPARYLGLHHLPEAGQRVGPPKPAAQTVRRAIADAEADEFHQPSKLAPVDGTDLWAKLQEGKRVTVRYTEGDDHDFLRYADKGSGAEAVLAKPALRVSVTRGGDLMACVNGTWLRQAGPQVDGAHTFTLDISGSYKTSGSNTIDVYATAQAFPVLQEVTELRVVFV